MSEIKFSADLDNSKLEASVKQSTKTITEFVEKTESAGKQIDNVFVNVGKQIDNTFVNAAKPVDAVFNNINKYGKSVVATIEEQKRLIKSIEDDIKSLEKAFDKMAPGKAKFAPGGLGSELTSARKTLREEYAILTKMQEKFLDDQKKFRFNETHSKALVENAQRDRAEFNKLHQQALKENEEYDRSHKSLVENVLGRAKKWILGVASIGAALKVLKSIVESTEITARKFEQRIESARAGLGYFFKTIASGDWNNFSNGLAKAVKGAVEFVNIMEKLNNRQNEQKIKSSEIDIQIAELRDKTYDKDEANNQERKKALEEIVRLEKQKYTDEAKLANDVYEANLKKAASDSGLAEDQIKNFIKEYSSFEDLIEIGEKYNKLQKQKFSPGMTNQFLNELQKEIDLLGPGAEEAGKYVRQVGKITTETRKQLADFATKANEAEAAFGQKNRRDKMQLAEVNNKIKDDAEAANKKAIEDAEKQTDLNNQLIEQRKQLEKAIISGNESEIKAIAARIVKLQEELALREKIAQQAIGAAIVRGEQVPKVNIPGVQATFANAIPNVLAGTPGLLKEEEKHIKGTVMLTKKALAEVQKAKENYAKDDEKADKEKEDRQKELISNAVLFTEELAGQLNLTEEETEAIGSMTQTVMQLARGNYIGAALGILAKIIGVFGQMGDVMSEPKWKKQIDAWDALIERQQRVIELSERTGGGEKALRDAIDLAQKEFDTINEAIIRERERRGTVPQDLLDARREAMNNLQDAQQALTEFLTGGVNQIDIAGIIADGFEEGKKSAKDFTDDFNDLMRNAINNALEDLSKPSITAWYSKFAADMESAGGLSAEEIVALKKEWDAIVEAEKTRREQIYTIAGITDRAIVNEGLTGQIRRDITEETGTELAGLFRRFADDQRVAKDYSIQGVNHLVGIEANTAETVNQLQLAITELQAINTNTKQVAVGAL